MPDSIGRRLNQARQERNLTIEKVEQLTRIRAHYLNALEADDYSLMPSAPQARGFLRNYASFLGMDIDAVLLELQRSQTPVDQEQLTGPVPVVDTSSALPGVPAVKESASAFWTSILDRFKKKATVSEIEAPDAIPSDDSVAETPVEQIPESASIAESESGLTVLEESVQVETPKKRGRKKKIYVTETVPVDDEKKEEAKEFLVDIPVPVVIEEEPVEETKPESEPRSIENVESEATESKPGFLARAMSVFSVRVNRPELEESPETEIKADEEQPVIEAAGEKIPEEQDQTVGQEQVEVPDEAENVQSKPGLLFRIISMFRVRLNRKNLQDEAGTLDQNVEVEGESVPTQLDAPQQSAEEILREIGVELRKRREMLSLTLEEVARHTRLRSIFLKAMEEGDFGKLPSPVQTRGMLANYVTFLDLDPDATMLRFADAIQARHRAKYPDKPAGSRPPMEVVSRLPPLRSFIAGDLLFGIGIVAVLFGLAFWGVQRIIAIQTAEQAFPTALSIPQILAGSPQVEESQQAGLIPAVDTPFGLGTLDATVAAGLPTIPANVNVQLNIIAVERTFMRVVADGKVEFDGRVLPGTAYPFEAESQIEVLTGNGSALRVTYNGRDLGLMGSFGEVVDRVFTAVGIATPTATLSPTPTNTPPATPTLTGSETPIFTASPAITGTP